MCDDASTDNTYDVIRSKYGDNERILILRNEENKGRAISSNRCIQIIESKYIARMDGDDISLPNRLLEEVQFLDNNSEFAFVRSPMIYFDSKGEYRKGKATEKPDVSDFRKEPPFCHGPSLIWTKVVKSLGGYSENKSVVRLEDTDLWYRMYLNGYKGYNILTPLYKMRNDYKAFSRRKAKYRWYQFRHGYLMRAKLGLKYPCMCSLPQLLKIFVPWQILYLTRRIR